jgi:hypothetical protein
MTIYYGGDAFTRYYNEAEAARLVSEGSQIEAAVELYYHQEGQFPNQSNAIQELLNSDYLADAPKGNEDILGGDWIIDYDEGHIRSSVGSASDEAALEVCRAARRQLKRPDPENILQCDGSDSPGGVLHGLEPCCIRTPS